MPARSLPSGIPDFETWLQEERARLAGGKPDEEKERKAAGLPWLPNLGAAKELSLLGRVGMLLGSKLGVIGLMAGIASAAAGVGYLGYLSNQSELDQQKRRQFETRLLRDHILRQHQDALAQAVPTKDGVRADTLGFVKPGTFPDPAADGGATGAGAAAGQDAAGAAGGDKAGGTNDPAAPDPNALAAQMMAQAQQAAANGGDGRGSGGRFGRLGGSFGGGSRSSGSLGSGLNRLLAAAGGSGLDALKAGKSVGLSDSRLSKQQRQRWASDRGITGNARLAQSSNQLRSLQAKMGGAAQTGNGITARSGTDAAWDSVQPTGAQLQTAGGVSVGPGISAAGASRRARSWRGAGGPIDGGGFDGSAPHVPDIPEAKNDTLYDSLITAAKALLAAVTAFSIIAAASRFMGPIGLSVGMWISYAIAAMGAMIAGIGMMLIAKYGQFLQGMLWVGIGGVVAVSGFLLGKGLGAAAKEAAKKVAVSEILPKLLPAVSGAAGATGYGVGDKLSSYTDEAKDAYRRKYGVDPDTHKVLPEARERFDAKYGHGAADAYNKAHEDLLPG